ncbi:MAG: hypothetical protein NXH73_07235, partial [Flavobacteriaceae bacterium]|nr:hypothetical protein [Flavobacteriaceae bacterium]
MRYLVPKFLVLFSFFFSVQLFAQGPGCPNLDAGPDQTIDCLGGGCVDLTATFFDTGETTTYSVESIPYAPPFPYTGLANPVSVGQDDVWSNQINLPFDFCFFGISYNQVFIGSNGIISFNPQTPGGFCAFTLGAGDIVPTPSIHQNAIMLYHDMDPRFGNAEVGYEVIGDAPCRTLVVSFANVEYFSVSAAVTTFQMVLYETTNAIDFYIEQKPDPNDFSGSPINGGRAVLGIQNNGGTQGFTPPGRNTGVWEATNEAWRFNPNGNSIVDLVWLDELGTTIGNTPTVNVCAPGTYTAQVTYTQCNGDIVVLTDDVVVTTSVSFTVDLGPDISTCDDSNIILDASADAPAGATYEWFFGGISQGPPSALNPTFTVTAPNSGLYAVEVIDPLDPTCSVTDDILIEFLPQPIIASPPIDLFICDDGATPGIFDLTVNTPIVMGGQDPVEFTVSYHNSQADADTGNAPIATPAAYPITGTTEVIYIRIENATGTCFITASFTITFASVTSDPVTPNPYVICDQDSSGDELVNLQAIFTPQVLGAQNPLEFNVTYHLSQADADADVGALPNPYNVTISPTTFFVRIENIAQPTCFDTAQSFDIILDIPPTINPTPTPLILCDDDNNGFGLFTLSDADDDITLGDPDLTVTYHGTELNAINNVDP